MTTLEPIEKMPATENQRPVGRSNDNVYVKRDLYPGSSLDDDLGRERHREDDDDRPPVLKLARYAISPAPLLSLHHHNGYSFESQLTSPIPRRKQVCNIRFNRFYSLLLLIIISS